VRLKLELPLVDPLVGDGFRRTLVRLKQCRGDLDAIPRRFQTNSREVEASSDIVFSMASSCFRRTLVRLKLVLVAVLCDVEIVSDELS